VPIVLHVRKTGSSNDSPLQILPGFYTADLTLTLTSARTIEYYIEGGGSISCEVVDYGGSLTPSGAATYTTEAKVASLLRLQESVTQTRLVFSTSTDPTLAEVTTFILQAEDEIDNDTHHSWRAATATDEYHDVNWLTQSVKLQHRKIRTMISGTDKVEFWDGSTWNDLVLAANGYTEGRANDFWVEHASGRIYFVATRPYSPDKGVRVTYRYGETAVPGDIEEAATKLAAIKILEDDDYKAILPEGLNQQFAVASKVETWRKDIHRILSNHREIPVVT
jgi:hypothetical protein